MLREVKYRAWIKDEQKLIDVKAIDFDVDGNIFSVHSSSTKYYNGYDLDNIELMQYIGLTDKNEVEIYEGDIIKIGRILYKVVWRIKRCRFSLVDLSNEENVKAFKASNTINYKVIGNIYENPDIVESFTKPKPVRKRFYKSSGYYRYFCPCCGASIGTSKDDSLSDTCPYCNEKIDISEVVG